MQRFWVWNNGTNKDRSGRLIWFDSSMAFCWYLNFFAPTWNVNSTVFSTEMQFSPSWFWLIKPDSWMFWCKSVIRGLWEGFEMKAKHLCSCSLCSCVPTGSSFFFFFCEGEFVYWSSTSDTHESLFEKLIILLFVFVLVLDCSLLFSLSRNESEPVYSSLAENDTRSSVQVTSRTKTFTTFLGMRAILHLLRLKKHLPCVGKTSIYGQNMAVKAGLVLWYIAHT